MPILGVIASSISGNLYSASYDSIASATLTSAGGIYFASIPQTYTHLQLRGIVRANAGGPNDWAYTRLNTDNSSSYNSHRLFGDGTSAMSQATGTTSYMRDFDCIASGGTANVWTPFILDILDYSNTNKYKTIRTLAGFDANGSGTVTLSSGLWMNTAAITVVGVDGGNSGLVAGTTIGLYGIKVA